MHPGPHDGLVVPGAPAEELLEGLIGVSHFRPVGEVDSAEDGLDALAVAIEQETISVGTTVSDLLWVFKVAPEPPGVVSLAVEDIGCEFGRVGSVNTATTNRPDESFIKFNEVVLKRVFRFGQIILIKHTLHQRFQGVSEIMETDRIARYASRRFACAACP